MSPETHAMQCKLAAAAIASSDFSQALIHIEQARTALHPEGVQSTARCEYLAALCFIGMRDLPQAKERLTEAWKLSPINNPLEEGGVTSAEDDEIIQYLTNLTKRIREMEEAGSSHAVMPVPASVSTEASAPSKSEVVVMNFNEALEVITAGTTMAAHQLHAVRDAINFALSDNSSQLDSEAKRHLARGLLGYCNWKLDRHPAESLSTLILERRALYRLGEVDLEEILVDCILETPLTWLQQCRYKMRLAGIEYDRKGLLGMFGWSV